MNRRQAILLGAVALVGVACAKPENTPPPERRMNTITVNVYTPKKAPIQTFNVDLELRDSVTGELLRHPVTHEPSQVKLTRSVREWSGTFTYWGDEPHPVRLRGTVTWPGIDQLGVEVVDNGHLIREAGRLDRTGKITIIYTTSGA